MGWVLASERKPHTPNKDTWFWVCDADGIVEDRKHLFDYKADSWRWGPPYMWWDNTIKPSPPEPDYDLEALVKQMFLDALAKDRIQREDLILNGYPAGSNHALEG